MTKRLILAVKEILPHIVDDSIDDPESDFEKAVLELVIAYNTTLLQQNKIPVFNFHYHESFEKAKEEYIKVIDRINN